MGEDESLVSLTPLCAGSYTLRPVSLDWSRSLTDGRDGSDMIVRWSPVDLSSPDAPLSSREASHGRYDGQAPVITEELTRMGGHPEAWETSPKTASANRSG